LTSQQSSIAAEPGFTWPLDTFLFDLGGVLINDLDVNYETSIRIFEMLGKRNISREEYVANLMPIQKLYRVVGLNEEESKQSHKLFRQFLSESIDSVVMHPDVLPILQVLRKKKLRVGIVTQYPHAIALEILEKECIVTYFDAIIGFEDSDEQKPSGKPVLIALSKLGSRANNSVFVGDMIQDIMAGHNAGVRTVCVYRGKEAYHQKDILARAKPDLIIEDLMELTKLIL